MRSMHTCVLRGSVIPLLVLVCTLLDVVRAGAQATADTGVGTPPAKGEAADKPGDESGGEDDGEPHAVIPPGQDELLADILGRGATLPHDCKFSSGDANGATIRATYTCASGPVVVTLVHPDLAPANATQTARFAMTVDSGTPPEGILAALAAHMRSREGAFEWKWLGRPRRRLSLPMIVLAVGLAAIAVSAWLLRARRRRPPR